MAPRYNPNSPFHIPKSERDRSVSRYQQLCRNPVLKALAVKRAKEWGERNKARLLIYAQRAEERGRIVSERHKAELFLLYPDWDGIYPVPKQPINFVCAACGKTVSCSGVRASYIKKGIRKGQRDFYCNQTCFNFVNIPRQKERGLAMRRWVELTCLACGKSFSRIPWKVRQNGANKTYCSRACSDLNRIPAKQVNSVCPVCGVTFVQNKQRNKTFCLKSHAKHHRRVISLLNKINNSKLTDLRLKRVTSLLLPPVELPCAACGQPLPLKMRKNHGARVQLKAGRTKFYCSFKCRNFHHLKATRMLVSKKMKKGLGVDGLARHDMKHRLRSSAFGKRWRKAVRLRDGNRCQFCDTTEGSLHVHHKKPLEQLIKESGFSQYHDLLDYAPLWDISNGVVICQVCHEELHNKSSGDKTLNTKLRRSTPYRHWKKEIRLKSEGFCQHCGDSAASLQVHHKTPFSSLIKDSGLTDYKALLSFQPLWDVNNGQLLCQPCHLEGHTQIYNAVTLA